MEITIISCVAIICVTIIICNIVNKSYFNNKKKLENIKYALFYLTLDIGRLEEICNQEGTNKKEDNIKYLIGTIKDTTKKYYNG